MKTALLIALAACIFATTAIAAPRDDTASRHSIDIDGLLVAHDGDLNAALIAAIKKLHPTGGTVYLNSLREGPNQGKYEVKSATPIARSHSEHEIVITTRSGKMAKVEQTANRGNILSFRNACNLRIENLRLLGKPGSGGGGIGINSCERITLTNIECRDADGLGIGISSTSSVSIEHTTVRESKAHGVRISNCEDITLNDVSIFEAGGYGIGVQNGTQLTRNLKILNSKIVRSAGDGIDIKGQRVEGPPLVVIDRVEAINNGRSNSAALDLRGHVSVKNVNIRLNPGSTGLRFRMGDDIGTNEKSNGWAGYGTATNVRIESLTPDGVGIVVQSGKVTLSQCSVSGPVKNKIHVYEWANRAQPIVIKDLSINDARIQDREQYLASGGSISKEPKLVIE